MKRTPRASRATLVLLAALGATVACSSEPDRKTAQRSASEAALASGQSREAAVFEGPGETLPREFDGWTITAAPRYFGPDNLYDLINGGAEIYAEFGLVRMVTAEYGNPGRPGTTVTIEVYDMGSVEGAFGRTARFLEGRQDPSDAGTGLPAAWSHRGILGAGDLLAWKDRYLVHLTLLDESAGADADSIAAAGRKLLPAMAEAVLERIGGDPPLPAELAVFPAANRIPRSEAWHPSRPAGIDGIGAGFTVRYADGEMRWTAFATSARGDAAEAEAAWRTLLGSERPGRLVAVRVAGRRLVGAVAEGDDAPPMERLEAFSGTLAEAFGTD